MNPGAYYEDAELFSRSKSNIATAKAVETFLIAETIDFIAFFGLLPTSVFQLQSSFYPLHPLHNPLPNFLLSVTSVTQSVAELPSS